MGLVHGFPSYIVVILNIKYFYIYGNTYVYLYIYTNINLCENRKNFKHVHGSVKESTLTLSRLMKKK